METGYEQLSDSQLLAVINAVLDALGTRRFPLPTDRELLDVLAASLHVGARFHAWQTGKAAQVDEAGVSWNEHKTSTTTWLSEAHNLTAKEGHRLIKTGQDYARFPIVGAAASSGAVLPTQADAITSVLRQLPADFPAPTVADAQRMMVGFAADHTSLELRRLTGHLLEVLSPETADQLEAARLERQHAAAMRNRHLEFTNNGHGSIIIRGSLPVTAAEPLIRIVDSYGAAKKRALDDTDPHAEYVTPSMQRADGLLAMIEHHLQQALAPSNGGDRPRIVITLNYADLLAQATAAGIAGNGINGPHGCLVSTGEPIAPSEVRQLLCDADILPVVLGGHSEILDVGQTERLAQGPIRYALEQRDQGCVFPGCDKPPTACHAH
ncbi:MAG TPA: DUF222 domain-containing protein, partial [Propionibacteriaceae bacterium]|nr:DUF222 domain-containing protein [Propionibacteriaceae bacterium]